MGLLNTFHPAQARFISSGACSSKFYATSSSRERVGAVVRMWGTCSKRM